MLDQDAPLVGATIGDVTGTRLGRGRDPRPARHRWSARRARRPRCRAARPSGSALARTLVEVGPPGEAGDDVLLILDEPTNHLDIDAIAWLEERLAAHRGGLVLVTHDRHVLDRVTTRILELDRGAATCTRAATPRYLEARAEREAQAARAGATCAATWPAPSSPGCAGARRPARASRRPASTRRPRSSRVDAEAAARATATSTSAFGAPRLGDNVVELARRRPPLRRRPVAVPRRRPVARPARAARHRRAERRRQVDAARRDRRHAAAGRGHGRGRHDRRARVRSPSAASTSTRRCASTRRSPGRRGSPTGRTPASSSGSGSTPTPSGRRSGCCRAASGAGCSSC